MYQANFNGLLCRSGIRRRGCRYHLASTALRTTTSHEFCSAFAFNASRAALRSLSHTHPRRWCHRRCRLTAAECVVLSCAAAHCVRHCPCVTSGTSDTRWRKASYCRGPRCASGNIPCCCWHITCSQKHGNRIETRRRFSHDNAVGGCRSLNDLKSGSSSNAIVARAGTTTKLLYAINGVGEIPKTEVFVILVDLLYVASDFNYISKAIVNEFVGIPVSAVGVDMNLTIASIATSATASVIHIVCVSALTSSKHTIFTAPPTSCIAPL